MNALLCSGQAGRIRVFPNENEQGVKVVFYCEDHTLGNVLAERLSDLSNVEYAAYCVPHPDMDPRVEMTIRLKKEHEKSSEVAAREAILRAITMLYADADSLEGQLAAQLREAGI